MRVVMRSAPLLLGFALAIGCTESNDPPTKTAPSQAGSDQTKAPASKAAADEYVLTVEGMTWPVGWTAKVRDALRTLPCVEASSVKVDKPTKEARFTVKKDSKCDIEAVKKAIKDAGYTVSGVKAPGDDMPLEDVVSLLRQYKSFGVERDEVYSFLTSLRNRVTDEALEDRVLEVADFVSGFCSPHMKVWEP